MCYFWKFALTPFSYPLPSLVEFSDQNRHWTFDTINNWPPVHSICVCILASVPRHLAVLLSELRIDFEFSSQRVGALLAYTQTQDWLESIFWETDQTLLSTSGVEGLWFISMEMLVPWTQPTVSGQSIIEMWCPLKSLKETVADSSLYYANCPISMPHIGSMRKLQFIPRS